VLELAPRRKQASGDVEVKGDAPALQVLLSSRLSWRGDSLFSGHQRKEHIQIWQKERSEHSNDNPKTAIDEKSGQLTACEDIEYLQVMLYLDFMLTSLGTSILSIAQWADSKQQDGTMSRKRLIGSPYLQTRAILLSTILQDNFATSNGLGGRRAW
jgi:hypothetical protein